MLPVLQGFLCKFKMADETQANEHSLQGFLEFADLQQKGLCREGVEKLDHLQQVDESDLEGIRIRGGHTWYHDVQVTFINIYLSGMSKVEVKCFFKKEKGIVNRKSTGM